MHHHHSSLFSIIRVKLVLQKRKETTQQNNTTMAHFCSNKTGKCPPVLSDCCTGPFGPTDTLTAPCHFQSLSCTQTTDFRLIFVVGVVVSLTSFVTHPSPLTDTSLRHFFLVLCGVGHFVAACAWLSRALRLPVCTKPRRSNVHLCDLKKCK